MEISGKVLRLGAMIEGTSSRGPWRKQDLIIETEEQFPKTVCLTCWTNQIEEIQKFAPGQSIKAQIDLSSREFNGKWYTDVRVWRFDPVGVGVSANSVPSQEQQMMHQTPPMSTSSPEYFPPADENVDDLPF